MILLLGCAYGSQIAYYAFVYVPAAVKRIRGEDGAAREMLTAQDESGRWDIGAFGWVLLVGWGLLFLVVAIDRAFPVPMYRVLRPVVVECVVGAALWFVATAAYAIVSFFRVGMGRTASSSLSDRLKNT